MCCQDAEEASTVLQLCFLQILINFISRAQICSEIILNVLHISLPCRAIYCDIFNIILKLCIFRSCFKEIDIVMVRVKMLFFLNSCHPFIILSLFFKEPTTICHTFSQLQGIQQWTNLMWPLSSCCLYISQQYCAEWRLSTWCDAPQCPVLYGCQMEELGAGEPAIRAAQCCRSLRCFVVYVSSLPLPSPKQPSVRHSQY